MKRIRVGLYILTGILGTVLLLILAENIYSDYRMNRDFKIRIKEYETMEINDIRLHYRQGGEGQPVLLIHGFMGQLGQFSPIWDELIREYRVIAVDLPGFGLSGKDLDFDYSKANIADTINEFMEKIGAKEVIVVGHSMGGEVAQHLAIRHPNRVRKLVLINTGGRYRREQTVTRYFGRGWISRFFIRNILLTYRGQKWLGKRGVHDPRCLEQEWNRPTLALNRKIPFEVLMKFNEDNSQGDTMPDPREIQVPTLILWGDEDPIISASHGQVYQKDIRGSSLVIFPQCGHIPFVEKPMDFMREFLAFAREDAAS